MQADVAVVDEAGRLSAHPALAPLQAQVAMVRASVPGTLGLSVPSPLCLAVGSAMDDPGAPVMLRFGLELAWLRGIEGLPHAAATLLAARAAAMALDAMPGPARRAAADSAAVKLMQRLAGPLPPIAQLAACWRLLAAALASTEAPPDLYALKMVDRLWHLAAPAEALLVAGGDDRLTLEAETGLNRYLCAPFPQAKQIAFSSCTASSITPTAFAAACAMRQALLAAGCAAAPDAVLEAASGRIVGELLSLLGVEDIAEAVLAASGTDATLLLTGLLAAEHPRETITTVLMSPSETGSGVPEAVLGRHFAPCTASGTVVEKGGAVDGFPSGLSLVTVALRDEAGLPRPPEAIAADCEAAIEAALQADLGRGRVVLHAIDGSKTGLAAPGLLALDLLAARFGTRLDIVVDACQLRIEPALVRRYLARGWPVLITGSKFFGAPGFCGAVLFPRTRLQRIAGAGRLPGGLGAYASLSGGSVSRRCPGLLLRWSAALASMRDFAGLPADVVRGRIDRAGAQMRAAMVRASGSLVPKWRIVPAPRPEGAGWSDRPSVLTFTVQGPDGLLPAKALRPLYRGLAEPGEARGGAEGASCLIGQPVQLAAGIGGLRIAISAAQIVADTDFRPGLTAVFGKLGRMTA